MCAFSKLGFDTAALLKKKKKSFGGKRYFIGPTVHDVQRDELPALEQRAASVPCQGTSAFVLEHLLDNASMMNILDCEGGRRGAGGRAAPEGNPHRSREKQTATPPKLCFALQRSQ